MENKNYTVLSDEELLEVSGGGFAFNFLKSSLGSWSGSGNILSDHKFKANRNTPYGTGGTPNLHNW